MKRKTLVKQQQQQQQKQQYQQKQQWQNLSAAAISNFVRLVRGLREKTVNWFSRVFTTVVYNWIFVQQ